MLHLTVLKNARRWSKELAPALIILFFSVVFSIAFHEPSPSGSWEGVYRTLFRFFRFTLFLCIPVYLLSPVYSVVVGKISGSLVQIEKKQGLKIDPFKHWVFRPFQGIGIGLLFETRLLAVLQVITGEPTRPFHFLPPEQFQPGRFLAITGITVLISLLLSTLWALDDMGVRYVNDKDQEMKMIGKYAGTIMPIIFAFYGIFSLVANFPKVDAFTYLLKIVFVLYPPFAAFAVFHNTFLRNRKERFSQNALLDAGGIWRKGGKTFNNSHTQ
jgi:hypothetical protein